jgi:sigma-E factor negative regulatory protein RseA
MVAQLHQKQDPMPNHADAAVEAIDLSCLLDGELDGPDRDRVLDRLIHDADAQRLWSTLHVVGDAIRSSEVACTHRAHFQARLAACIAGEPTIVAPRWTRDRQRMLRRVILPGAAVVAAVAMLIVVAVPQLRSGAGDVDSRTVAATKAGPAIVSTPNVAALPATGAMPINPYLRAHREFAQGGVLPPSAPYLRTSATLPAESSR